VAGTYARNGGEGLRSVTRDSADGWSLGPVFPEAADASFGAYASRHDLYYFVDEQGSALNVLRRRDGWEPLARIGTMGAQPCYVALSSDQSWLAVANYGDGSIALWRLDPESGLPLDLPEVRQNGGSGPVAGRQDGPHAHCACFSPDGRWLYHADLGTDEVLAYPFDAEAGWLGDATRAYAAPAGSGPRHLVFHPHAPLALLVSELASTITVMEVGNGLLVPRETLSTLPMDFGGESLAGHVSLNAAGDRAYVTNRGHDSIAVFAWDDGVLELRQHVPSGGASPRAFVVLETEHQLALANEEGGNLTFFDLAVDGTLSPMVLDLPLPGAVFLMTVPAASR
jgi:6-phosphogluconolactonase